MEDSRSESGDTRRSEPKNEPTSPGHRVVGSLLTADLPVRCAMSPEGYCDSSPESATNDRVVASPTRVAQDRRHQQPYNMTYYGGPHGVAPAHQLLQQHRQHQLQRQHHLQSTLLLHPAPADNLSTYPPETGDESAAVETELYCSPDRDQYYGQYYTQRVASAAVKLRGDMDRM